MHLEGQDRTRRRTSEAGYAMAALLVSIAIMGIVATMALPAWRQAAKREKEAELFFRAGQYAHAIEKFRRKVGGGAYPPDIDFLVRQKYLRKKFKDPMTKDGEWRIVTPQELQAGGVGTGAGWQFEPVARRHHRDRGSTFGSGSGFGSTPAPPARARVVPARRPPLPVGLSLRRPRRPLIWRPDILVRHRTAPVDAPSITDRSLPSPARAPRSRSKSSKAATATISGS